MSNGMGIRYKGSLYGYVSGEYIPLQATADDVDRMQDTIARLREYVQHLPDCPAFSWPINDCDCGLDELLKEASDE